MDLHNCNTIKIGLIKGGVTVKFNNKYLYTSDK